MAGYRQRFRPADIRFTQDSVGSRFTDGRYVSDTFHQLLDGRIGVDDIPAIEAVVDGAGEWWAVTGNRRLYVFRLLETLGVVQKIPVNVVSMNSYDVRRRLGDRKTTSCGGRTVEMRQPEAERRINRAIREWQKTKRCTFRGRITASEALEPSASGGAGLLENEETDRGGGAEDTWNLIAETRGDQRKSSKYQRITHPVEPIIHGVSQIPGSRRDGLWPNDSSRHQRITHPVAQTNVEPIIHGVSQIPGSRRDGLWPNDSSRHQRITHPVAQTGVEPIIHGVSRGNQAAIENARRAGQRGSSTDQRNVIVSNSESEDSVVTRQPRSLNQGDNNSQQNSDAQRCCFCCEQSCYGC